VIDKCALEVRKRTSQKQNKQAKKETDVAEKGQDTQDRNCSFRKTFGSLLSLLFIAPLFQSALLYLGKSKRSENNTGNQKQEEAIGYCEGSPL